jgi:C4-dicarboxylate transporter DctM subunit
MTGYGQGPRGICILFVIQAQAPDVEITSIYRGIIPFLLIVLMFLFPGLALWLPKALYG